MSYTEEELKKFSVALGENTNESCLFIFSQELNRLCKSGYKQIGKLKRLDSSASYYVVPLENPQDDEGETFVLELVGAYALNVVGPLDKEPEIELAWEDDAEEYQEYFQGLQQKNRDCDYAFKKLVRIVKHIHADMVKNGVEAAKVVGSEEILELLDLLPVEDYKRFDTLQEKLRYVLLQLGLLLEGKTDIEAEDAARYRELVIALQKAM